MSSMRTFADRTWGRSRLAATASLGAALSDPAARGALVGRTQVAGANTRMVQRVAIEHFNSTSHGKTVKRLTKLLGEPLVSIGAGAGSPGEVRLTVAWEFSWYQWAIDVSGPCPLVIELAKGTQVAQLDSPARQWNASVCDGAVEPPGTRSAMMPG